MARFVLVTFTILLVTAASPQAPRQSPPKVKPRSYYQQPLPRPLTEVLSSNFLLQMADLVGGRPSAIPPILTEDSGRRNAFNSVAARQAIAMTDSQQIGVRKADDNIQLNTNKNTACTRAILVCCKPHSEEVRYGCFEALGCPGFFVDVNPCSKTIIRHLTN